MNKIFSFVIVLTTSALFCSCSDSGKVVSLFDGKSLANWEIQSGGRFSAENGVLKVDKGVGWLRSVDTFATIL